MKQPFQVVLVGSSRKRRLTSEKPEILQGLNGAPDGSGADAHARRQQGDGGEGRPLIPLVVEEMDDGEDLERPKTIGSVVRSEPAGILQQVAPGRQAPAPAWGAGLRGRGVQARGQSRERDEVWVYAAAAAGVTARGDDVDGPRRSSTACSKRPAA